MNEMIDDITNDVMAILYANDLVNEYDENMEDEYNLLHETIYDAIHTSVGNIVVRNQAGIPGITSKSMKGTK